MDDLRPINAKKIDETKFFNYRIFSRGRFGGKFVHFLCIFKTKVKLRTPPPADFGVKNFHFLGNFVFDPNKSDICFT